MQKTELNLQPTYHSVISICKFHGISILEYLKKFFREIVAGNVVPTSIKPSSLELYRVQPTFIDINRDYQKLMPATIGINPNKSCANEHRDKLA